MNVHIKYKHWIPRMISIVMPITAITLRNTIYVRGDHIDHYVFNHETIHVTQYQECGTFKFLMLYVWYYVKGLWKYKFDHYKAYYAIPFEQEAYTFQDDNMYLTTQRKPFAWKEYV